MSTKLIFGISLLAALAAGGIFSACGEGEADGPKGIKFLDGTATDAGVQVGEPHTTLFSAEGDWKVEIIDTEDGSDWLEVAPVSGPAGERNEIVITAIKPNLSDKTRGAHIKITLQDESAAGDRFAIRQDKTAVFIESITVSPASLTLKVDESKTLTASYKPEYANTETHIHWQKPNGDDHVEVRETGDKSCSVKGLKAGGPVKISAWAVSDPKGPRRDPIEVEVTVTN